MMKTIRTKFGKFAASVLMKQHGNS
jgi:hypothetical protein